MQLETAPNFKVIEKHPLSHKVDSISHHGRISFLFVSNSWRYVRHSISHRNNFIRPCSCLECVALCLPRAALQGNVQKQRLVYVVYACLVI